VDTRPNLPSDVQASTYAVALAWLDIGVPLLPLQPGTKMLLKNFGPRRHKIVDLDGAYDYFAHRRCNLALACGGSVHLVVLDIDSQDGYAALVHHWPFLLTSFTVKTRDGYHIYLRCPVGFVQSRQVGQVEIKADGACVTTWPSVVAGHIYTPLDLAAPILEVDPLHFPLLSVSRKQSETPLSREKCAPCGADLVSRIKSAWSIVEIGEELTKLQTSDSRWYRGNCPSGRHKDAHPSFWIDSTRGTFGCHSCDFHGDVINLFAFQHKLTIQDAIAQMAQRLPVGGAA
jgi:hypothetical protein